MFTLDEAVTNYRMLRDCNVPVSMLWFCGGHCTCFTGPSDVEPGAGSLLWRSALRGQPIVANCMSGDVDGTDAEAARGTVTVTVGENPLT